MTDMPDRVEINVAVQAFMYASRDAAEADRDRALPQFTDKGISVYVAVRDDVPGEAIVAFVGPNDQFEAGVLNEWEPNGGEVVDIRPDIGMRLCRQHLNDAGAIVVNSEDGSYEARPDLVDMALPPDTPLH